MKILHFADAHIDMANYGRHDPKTGLPLRVLDFIKSLDTIVDTAIAEKVDLVIFAGDTYKDRSPAPTYQREWERRILRLSQAEIPTLLLVGNHDLSPSLGRAHALDPFHTLEVPFIHVISKPTFLTPQEINNVPVQIMAIPWLSRSGMMASFDIQGTDIEAIYEEMETKLSQLVQNWFQKANPNLPTILTAHASVQGAVYGGERMVMLGRDLTLPGSLVKNPNLDYVALGHIHKAQNLNEEAHPPVIYPGSIERVDFGEANDDKFFVIAEVNKGNTSVEWHKLDNIRPFIDRYIQLKDKEQITEQLLHALPPAKEIEDAIVRLVVDYPREWEPLIDDATLRNYAANAFEFHLIKRPQEMEARIRLPEDKTIGNLTPLELLGIYWRANHLDESTISDLGKLAQQIIQETQSE